MPSGPVRRSQLIAPFGVGAMTIVRDGTSLITAGLDHWFERESGDNENRDLDEYRIKEWRLQRQLDVDHFRLPPDYRRKGQYETVPNANITVPFLRFPQWHVCPGCKTLDKRHLSERGRIECRNCGDAGVRRILVQVPFVAMCAAGHIQDFPWREWAHRSASPTCTKPMKLRATGGTSLASQRVECGCGKWNTLASITAARPDGSTYLSDNVEPGAQFLCRGRTPWHGDEEDASCQEALRGSLRSASNVYFALTRSAIYIPRGNEHAPADLVALFENPVFATLIDVFSGTGAELTPEFLRSQHRDALMRYSDNEIRAALKIAVSSGQSENGIGEETRDEDPETTFRRPEFEVLQTAREEPQLLIKAADATEYEREVARYFSRISLVHKLKETRTLCGFARVYPENGQSLEEQKALLRKRPLEESKEWLPAYTVFGEGIYLELDEELVQRWETREEVEDRVRPLARRYVDVRERRKLRERSISPRFVLLHTFAHLLMNRLTFDCGYGSAALRERLYVSADRNAPMAGILVYTAAGDSEGTMGGLVRMGKPGYLEPVIRRALEAAQWCSSDPVCMEMAAAGGQGPDSCNLAACHNCGLVPETACEEFNRFLDRALAVGDAHNRRLGFFS